MLKIFDLFAFVKVQRELHINIWSSLSSILSEMILDLDISEVTSENLCSNFESYYRYKIPLHPMNTLISKMLGAKLLLKEDTIIKPNFKEMKLLVSNNKITANYFIKLIDRINKYFEDNFDVSVSNIDIQEALIKYLDDYQADILKGLGIDKLFVVKETNNKINYMLNKFIAEEVASGSEKDIFLDLIIANINLTYIFYSPLEKNKEFPKCNLYIDTRIILRLIGVEGEFRRKEYKYLFDIFLEKKFNLKIFSQHYDEVVGILDDCIYWLEKKSNYKPEYASPTLRHFVENKYDSTDVLLFKKKVETILFEYNIKPVSINYLKEDSSYNIDEEKIYSMIMAEYKKENPGFEEGNKENIVWNDVKAISYIYRKRKWIKPSSLNNLQYIFLTTNFVLAKVSKIYAKEVTNYYYALSECATDSYFATYLWLNSSSENLNLLRSKLLSSSCGYIQANPELKKKYLNTIIAQKEKNILSEEEFLFLKETEIAQEILQDKTFNDIDNFSDKLPEEIIHAFKESIEKKAIEKEQEKIENLRTEAENIQKGRIADKKTIEELQVKIEKIKQENKNNARNYTKIILAFLFILVFLLNIIPDFGKLKSEFRIGIIFFSAIINLIIIFFGFTGKGLYKVIYSKILKKMNKDL